MRRGPIREVLHRFRKHPLAIIGLAVLFVEVLLVLLAPYIAPYDPMEQHLNEKLLSPSRQHIMGVDNLGRDVYSRILYGGRNTLGGAFVALFILVTIGVAIGGIAGYVGGILDVILMRITDSMLSFPYLVLALGLAAALSPDLFSVVLAVSLTWWGHFARVMRGMVLSIRENTYIESARAIGVKESRIFIHHVLPNVVSPILVLSALDLGLVILAIASLSYLGLGIQPPAPEWGMMLNEARLYMFLTPHLMVFPGVMIFVTVLSANLFGDGLRDALDPRWQNRQI